MTVEPKQTKRRRWGVRAAAAGAATALAFTGVIAAAPAFAAEAPAPISAELAPGEIPYIEVEAIPAPIEPIAEVVDEVTRPLGMSIFLVSAVTLGAGGLAVARLTAARRQTASVKSPE